MKELEVEGTFVRKVNTSGVPFHSYYMNDVAPALLKELQKVDMHFYRGNGLGVRISADF